MGKIKQGILGGFNGTTGSVVGASWKGIAYMRGKAQSIANPRTDLQVENRTKFGVISDMCSKLKTVIDEGFKSKASKQSPFNAAVKANMLVAGDFSMTTFKIAEGNLIAPSSGQFGEVTETTFALSATFPYVPSADMPIHFVALFETMVSGVYVPVDGNVITEEGRTSYTFSGAIPSGLQYQSIYGYAYLTEPNTNNVSDSTYLGSYIPD